MKPNKPIERLPLFEDFKTNEATLPVMHQTTLLKQILKSFDLEDLKYYLQGYMLNLDISNRKRLKKYLDEQKYPYVVRGLIHFNNDDPVAILKLRKLLKVIMTDEKTGQDLPPGEEATEFPFDEQPTT